ncbi:hypothetical protein CONPUDRAFT_137278 [Coniophora puteana RWD-64-598 SS2]|uniref:Uncharacterized protein n=1 Tax=Coniophora puteana (strain RWD-64-598) TaxID=741705 RepID=A0A5M3MPX5_CONPW|nr:uncharacterized protein CONPUDRAFT_137278 [Coniophora puteana RWD-64-598 SS2]EIW81229.1 hypothetical protein CONPUDRAFT_137278 [Coniophora puteana RWD-64-598 SS2]
MPPRLNHSTSSKRPLSAIYLGPQPPSGSQPPDLPEPPESPSSASSASGLPSPPATNSTGSGSVGDNSTSAGSVRQRPASTSQINMQARSFDKYEGRDGARHDVDDDDDDDHNGEDETARYDLRLSLAGKGGDTSDLQRVKSLTQRNRLAMDRLSTFSRLSSPSPSPSGRSSRSPLPPHKPSTAPSGVSSRVPSHSHNLSLSSQHSSQTHSGSETEREPPQVSGQGDSYSYGSSSPEPELPALSRIRANSHAARERRISAPASPGKALASARQPSPGPSRTPRKRVSVASALSSPPEERFRPPSSIANAALAAVASSRRSPTSSASLGRRSRQPLPQEFRRNDQESPEDAGSAPVTPYRSPRRERNASGSFTDPRDQKSYADPQYSPRSTRLNRSSTIREVARQPQSRWEDMSPGDASQATDVDESPAGRRQSMRGGSMESPLNAGRLASAGLRAAGIGMRSDQPNQDVFGQANDPNGGVRRAQSAAVKNSPNRSLEWEADTRNAKDERSRAAAVSSGSRENVTPSDGGRSAGKLPRPPTSMGGLYPAVDESAQKSPLSLHRRLADRASVGGSPSIRSISLSSTHSGADTPPPERTRHGILTRRHTTLTPSNGPPSAKAEHAQILLNSLSMFESILSRLPQVDSEAVPELRRDAQTIVHASEQLNHLLRAGNSRALEEQIAAEVDGEQAYGAETGEVWRRVGGEYRECLRWSDELVRSTTNFLLGAGKLLKESAGNEFGHSRTVSLDEEFVRIRTPEGSQTGRRSEDGRSSSLSRRSWEPNALRRDSLARRSLQSDTDHGHRPVSSRDEEPEQDTNLSKRSSVLSLASRRLFSPREQRQQLSAESPRASFSDIAPDRDQDYSPSASRHPPDRPRHALAIPPPLSTLPSESIIAKIDHEKPSRRKTSVASVSTIRANTPTFPLSTNNPTTAVTPHTVSNSPEAQPFPLAHDDSPESTRSHVTFSRPAGVTAMSGLQQHSRKRNISTTSIDETDDSPLLSARSQPATTDAGRDNRRRTVGVRASRASLDGGTTGISPSQSHTYNQRRERRRPIAEVFAS